MDRYLVEVQEEGQESLSISDMKKKEVLFSLIPTDSRFGRGYYETKISPNLNSYEKAELVGLLAQFMMHYMIRCNVQRESIQEMQEELDRLNRIVYTV